VLTAGSWADQGEYLTSESSFCRVLHEHQQVQRCGRPGRSISPDPSPGCVRMDPINSGAWTSPAYPRACVASGCTSIWLSMAEVARSWPGTSLTARIPSWQPNSSTLHASGSGSTSAASSSWNYMPITAGQLVHAGSAIEWAGRSALVHQAAGERQQPVFRSSVRTVNYWPNYPSRPFASKEEVCR